MLRQVLLFNLILCPMVIPKRRHKEKESVPSEELTGHLISSLRDDANLDLSMDEEYEDLRAELLAYHTALSSLTGPRAEADSDANDADAAPDPTGNIPNTRRSMKTTPCWKLGGICVSNSLCRNHRFLTEVPGCKANLEVCCFTWNIFQTRDMRDKGIGNNAFPWTHGEQMGGKGLVGPYDQELSEDSEEILANVHIPNVPVGLQGQAYKELNKKKNKKHKKNNNLNAPILVIVKQNKK